MPLRALIDGRDLIAPVLDDVEWETLRANVKGKRAALTLPCCGASAFPRVSKLGTRHFVHRRADGCSGSGETFQHLWAKAEILAACGAAGWQAQPEAVGQGWRADVLATCGAARIAFEVQWSRQDDETSRFRQERYAIDGIRACWLYRGDVPAPPVRELPIFRLEPDDEQVAVIELGGRRYGVGEFVGLLLAGRVHFSPSLMAHLRISFVDMDCWRCHKPAHVFYAQQYSRCGHEVSYAFSREPGDTVSNVDPQVLTFVHRWLVGEGRNSGIKLGPVKQRYSGTMQRSYLSFGCPHCDALFGEWFVRGAMIDALTDHYSVANFEVDVPAIGVEGRQGHWCLPADGSSYCGQKAAQRAA